MTQEEMNELRHNDICDNLRLAIDNAVKQNLSFVMVNREFAHEILREIENG